MDFRNGPNWDNVGRATYQHNNQNFVTMITHEYRDMVYGFWCNAYRYEYIYDLDNLLLIATEIDAEGCNGWQLEYQKLYAYDENGNNIEKLGQDWNPSDSTWINDLLYLYEYNSNNALIQTICLAWDPGSLQWENVWQEYYTYTQQDSLETVLKNTWASESKWENYTFRMIAYDNDGNWLEDATQLWDSTNWANYFRYLATWDEPVSAKIDLLIPNNYQLFQNYPNPFNPKTKITYQIPELSFVTLKVYDVLGREVKTLVNEEKPAGNYEVEFDASNLPSGIYFYGIQTSSFRETKKMIILK